MAYSRITRTRYGKGALDYAYGIGKGHNENEMRNQLITGVNLVEGVTYLEQMQMYWNKARDGHKTQVLRLVTSYSRNELDPENPADIEKACLIQQELLLKRYPNRQAVIFVQTDGKSGLVHTHTIISDVEMDNYKGCDKEQYHFDHIKSWTNEVAKRYIDLDFGNGKTEDKTTQTERTKREQGVYVWKDDLKNRIHDAMTEAESQDDFEVKLPEHGVNFEKKSSKKYGEGYTYELMDLSNVPEGVKVPDRALKARSRKLGDSYGIAALNYVLDAKRKERLFANKDAIRKALDEFNLENMGISTPDDEKRLKTQNTASNDADTEDEQPELQEMNGVKDVDDTQYQQFVQQTIQRMRSDADSDDMDGNKSTISKRLAYLQSKYGDMSEDTQDDDVLLK